MGQTEHWENMVNLNANASLDYAYLRSQIVDKARLTHIMNITVKTSKQNMNNNVIQDLKISICRLGHIR